MRRITFSKLYLKDVQELQAASERLAIVANALKAAKYANGPALVQLLIEANDPIVRLIAKGGGAIARSLERSGVVVASSEAEPESTSHEGPSSGEDSEQSQGA